MSHAIIDKTATIAKSQSGNMDMIVNNGFSNARIKFINLSFTVKHKQTKADNQNKGYEFFHYFRFNNWQWFSLVVVQSAPADRYPEYNCL